MSYESALQRVSQLRATSGIDSPYAGSTGDIGTTVAFGAQLAGERARLGSDGGGAAAGVVGASSMRGVPILSIADQYRMLGIDAPMAGGVSATPAPRGSGTTGARMVELARKELGVTESSGNNESPRIRTYRTATAGAENTPGPWCAYFVSYLAREAGAPIGAGGNGTGYVPTLEAWGKQENRFTEFGSGDRPQPGDMVIFDWGGDGVADHTGIVESVDANGTINTIEGNASDRVMRRSYAATTNDIRGYVRAG